MSKKLQPRPDIEYSLNQVTAAIRDLIKRHPEAPASLETLARWVDDIADQATNPR